mmetsp:Transcript_13254/g.24383  ORF Transcript_13254/g.24383 Transcript_13254/m.24383 type:complete len:418 (+) Transcript_13254:23-1276(+)
MNLSTVALLCWIFSNNVTIEANSESVIAAESAVPVVAGSEFVTFKEGGETNVTDDFGNKSIYPEWSWDNVRKWVAIRRDVQFDRDQIAALAAQDIVMIEKTTGWKTYGSVEVGTLETAKAIKRVNPHVTVLFYLNSMVHYGGYLANENFKNEWSMRNPRRGGDYYKWRGKYLSYDHTNLEFREWWIQRALDMVAHDEIDGIFIDAIVKAVLTNLPVKNHDKAYFATATELRERFPEGKLLIGNALRVGRTSDGNLKHLKYLDGSYLENWQSPKPWQMKKTLELMSTALKQGRMIMLTAEPNHHDEGELNRLTSLDDRYKYVGRPRFIGFTLGFFLLIVEPNAYFSYRTGVDARPKVKCVFDNTRFEAITRKLGKPAGEMVQEGGHVFSREFEYLKVRVNLVTMEGVLTVKDDKGEEL